MDTPQRLNSDESRQLAEHLASLARSGLPLPGGLRAAAEEIPSRRLSSAMLGLARELEAGRSLDSVLAAHPKLMPPHMQRLIVTGMRSGNLPNVLVRLVDLDRTSFDLRRGLLQAIAYPVLLFGMLLAVAGFILTCVAPGIGRVFEDFGTELPLPTKLLMEISGSRALPTLIAGIAAIAGFVIVLRMILPAAAWQRLLTLIPLVGPTVHWRGVANWSRLLSLLLKENIPLPDAVELAAEGVDSALMRARGARIAGRVAAGVSLADAVDSVGTLPPSLSPVLHWGQEQGLLPEALDSVAETFETRVQLRAALLRSILPPVTFIFIAMSAVMLLNAIMSPLVRLITDLSRASSNNRVGARDVEAGALAIMLMMAIVWAIATAILLATRSSRGRCDPNGGGRFLFLSRRSWGEAFRVLYWVGLFLLLLVAMGYFAGFIGLLLWLATVVIAVMVKVRHAEMERRSLLWGLAVAMEKDISLPACARAFARESHSALGARTQELAMSMENGVPLASALETSKIRLPNDALVAVRTGADTGGQAAMIKSSARRAASLDAAIHGAIGRVAYLSAFILLAAAVIVFLAIKIVPAYIKIFEDFGMQLPPVTLVLVNVFKFLAEHSEIVILGFWMLLATLAYIVGRYTDAIRWDPPLLRRFGLPLDGAVVLRSLAEAVREHRALHVTLASLARQYPKGYIRRYLRRAEQKVAQGVDWCDSLQQSGLVPAAEAGVLKASVRVGNLVWALNDMADRLVRKFTTRLIGVMSVVFPLVILSFAGMVLLIAAGMLYPLVKLIANLS